MRIYCLTQKERIDRQQMFCKECLRHDINGTFFFAIDSENRFDSFCQSQIGMLKTFLETDDESSLMLEDDVCFSNYERLETAISELPANWDMLYLGANIVSVPAYPVRYSDNLFRIKAAWTTHAILYSRKMAERIVSEYKSWEESGMYDDWLSRVIIPDSEVFIMAPMIATQRPVRSDLWNNEVDYTGCFIEGNKMLR